MKVLALALLALVAVVASKSIDFEDVMYIEEHTAYDYLERIGKPLADAILRDEEEAEEDPSRIVGGSSASRGQFPYQAGLIIQFSLGQAICGGSVLSERRVLTAAHCWNDGRNQGTSINVVVGTANMNSGGSRQRTSDVQMHGSWNPNNARNDIAMIRLSSRIRFNNNVAAVALPSGVQLNENFVGSTATASGYGATRDMWPPSYTLNHVNLPVISNNDCSRSFPGLIQSSTICTSGAGGRSTCQGDSGGPLVVTRNNRRILIGVTSFGHVSGCQSGHPSAFARVTYFISWINMRL